MGGWVTARPTQGTPQPTTGQNPGGLLRKLVKGDISQVKCLEFKSQDDARPVFQLTFRDGTSLVIKMEGSGNPRNHGSNLQWGSKLMRQVSPQMKVQVLDPAEVLVLRGLPAMAFTSRPGRLYFEHLMFLTTQYGDGMVWCKMPFLGGLYSIEKGAAENVEQLFETLSKPSYLQTFGRILAIDLFIGNTDRIDPTNGHVQNAGNIMFQKLAEGQLMMVGLDYYESAGELSDLHGPIPYGWGGEYLRNDSTRQRFADLVVAGLNELFQKKFHFDIGEFGGGHAWQIAHGMRDGVEVLHQFLSRRLRLKNVPRPILERAMRLGWYDQQN